MPPPSRLAERDNSCCWRGDPPSAAPHNRRPETARRPWPPCLLYRLLPRLLLLLLSRLLL